MKTISIELTSREAEDLLFALKMRASQTRVPAESAAACERMRQRVNEASTKAFGWDEYPDRHKADGSIRVNIQTRNRW